jgi:hypothetical protein
LLLAIAGELVTPSSTDIDGHKKGKGKRAKQRTRRYLEETSESSDNDIRKNKNNSLKKQKKRNKDSLFIFLKVIFHIIDVSRSRNTFPARSRISTSF